MALRVVVFRLWNAATQQPLAFVAHQLELSAADRSTLRLFVTSSPGNPYFSSKHDLLLVLGSLPATEHNSGVSLTSGFMSKLVYIPVLFHKNSFMFLGTNAFLSKLAMFLRHKTCIQVVI